MLSYALAFFLIALIAALIGFSSVAATAAAVAKLVFVGFLVLSTVALAVGLLRQRS